MLRVPKT